MNTEVSTLDELQDLISNEQALLIYFYNDHCAPCKSLRPKILEMMEQRFPKMELRFVNSEKKEIPAHYGVYDNPTLLVFFDRKEYIRVSKYVSTQQLAEKIERYYSMVF